MALKHKDWRPASVHRMAAEFLRAERHGILRELPHLAPVVERPDLTSAGENHLRWRLLHLIRCGLVGEIPPDTRWFEVRCLTEAELGELHVISRCGWDDPGDQNQLLRVAVRRPLVLDGSGRDFGCPILWGHSRSGPFTILEGNHRLVAYALTAPRPDLATPVIVGVSPTPCFFHFADPPVMVANDLWR